MPKEKVSRARCETQNSSKTELIQSAYEFRVRCDRLEPCHNCSSRGLGEFCVYSTKAPSERLHGRAHLQDRINHLENTIVSLMKGIQPSINTSIPNSDTTPFAQGTLVYQADDQRRMSLDPPSPNEALQESSASHPRSKQDICTTENGSIKIRDAEVIYASNAHWAAVLDSVDELRNELSNDGNIVAMAGGGIQTQDPPCPRLFYGGGAQSIDMQSILECLPPRIVVDRSVSRYFNSLDATAGKSNSCFHGTLQGLTGYRHTP